MPHTTQDKRNELCSLIKKVATSKGITQDLIAERSGIARNNINKMLSGKHSMLLDNFIKIIESIDCSIVLKDNNSE